MGRTGDEHVREWAELHLTEPPEGFVGGWLRAAAAVARPLARAGISPNAVTVAALIAALAAVPPAAYVGGWLGPAAACLAITVSGLLDALDGAVAVQAGRTTKVGFLLDSALDRIADAAFPATLVLVAGPDTTTIALAVAATAACWYLEYVRARATLASDPGAQVITPGERPTRIVLAAVGCGLPFLATATLWASAVIVGGSAVYLLAHSIRRLSRLDAAAAPPDRPAPTG
ncbi:MAG: CDP-alcohol phosphatidyltransferase family protein [Acidimicrobiales bacterium]